jgi:hypothetical protein
MEARSHTIVAMEKQHSKCVFVAVVIQHEIPLRRITHIFICGLSSTTTFFHLISYTALFLENVIDCTVCALISTASV